MAAGGPEETSAAERLLVRVLAISRVVILCQAVSALVLHWHATRAPVVIKRIRRKLGLGNQAS